MPCTRCLRETRLDGCDLGPHDVGAVIEDSGDPPVDPIADPGLLGAEVDEGNHDLAFLSRTEFGELLVHGFENTLHR